LAVFVAEMAGAACCGEIDYSSPVEQITFVLVP
jgi:hypothetical protein